MDRRPFLEQLAAVTSTSVLASSQEVAVCGE